MLRASLQRAARRLSRRQASAVICQADFAERHQRLMAQLAYKPIFKSDFSTLNGGYESGLVSGAKVVRMPALRQ